MKFLHNFLEKLCLTENIIDISGNCSATQSSDSKWSRPEDANRVLFDNNGEFANHTAPELNPWLKIDLGMQRVIQFVIIQNRTRKPFNEIASNLIVECSSDDHEYSLIHKGELEFGSFPDSFPLILPLKMSIPFRYLKLSLVSKVKQPLHLKRVNILVSKEPDLTQGQTDVVFYSSRLDGLGERLKSLLNAMVLSSHYGAQFKFTWPSSNYLDNTHAINEADAMFSLPFLKNFLVDKSPNLVHELDKNINFFDRNLDKKNAILVSQNSIYKQQTALINYIKKAEFSKAFSAISFHEKIEHAIYLARKLDIPKNIVSIHLRAGDIIYGRYRHGDRYTNKVISYAQADFMISTLRNSGANVLLFGQNSEICNYFSKKYNAYYFGNAPELKELSSVQLAIFDMVLMSRTKRIFSGNSGFAQLSELIGDAKIISPEDSFNIVAMSEHIAKLLDSEESKYFDQYQNAFSCWHYVFRYKSIVGIENAILYLEKATAYDVENIFYSLVLATLYYEKGDVKSSEVIIQNVLSRKVGSVGDYGSFEYLKRYKNPDGTGQFHRYKKTFVMMETSGVKGASELVKSFSL